MRVLNVRYYGLIRHVLGTSAEEVLLPEGATVRELILALGRLHGERFTGQVQTLPGREVGRELCLFSDAVVLVDGVNINEGRGLDTQLGSEVEIALTSPLAGG